MAAPRAIRILRWSLLVLLLLLVAGLVVLYLLGRRDRRPEAAGDGGGGPGPAKELTAVGEGFDYTLEEGGDTRFRVRGESYQVDRERKVYLERMGLTLYTETGDVYEVESAEAVFDPATEEADLRRGVVLRGPLDLELTTPTLEVTEEGQVVVSRKPVAFRYGEVAEGGAQRLRGELGERLFVLAGDVWMRSLPGIEPPFAQRSNRLFFDRPRHHVRGDGDVRTAYGGNRLDAQRVNLWLTEDDRRVEFVRAMAEVRGALPAVGEGGEPVTFEAASLSALFEPESTELRKFELEGSANQRALLRSVAPGPLLRRFAGGYVVGKLAGGRLTEVEAFVGVRFHEYDLAAPGVRPRRAAAPPAPPPLPDGSPLGIAGLEVVRDPAGAPARELRAERGKALYGPDGELTELFLYDAVEYQDRQVTAASDRARFDVVQDQGEFFGRPATLTSADGEIVAPHLLYTRSSGLLYADGGTRSELQAGAVQPLAASPLARGEGPVRVEAAAAFLRPDPRAFLFRGQVRAWRGENLLLADELSGDEAEDKVEAKGDVRTVWYPEPQAGGEERPPPIEVTADSMIYRQGEGVLVYRGGVRSVQGERVVSSDVLTVELDDDRRAERMIAEGEVVIEGGAGRVISGDLARYEPGGEEVEVEGDEVVMKDGKGGEVTGKRLVYHFETGMAEVQGGGEEAGGS